MNEYGPPSKTSSAESCDELTRLLCRAGSGEAPLLDALLPLVYEQLRAIANERMAGERRDHTLQATALVHEAYLRLVKDASANHGANDAGALPWSCRAHFFAAAAEAMRRILIEHARMRGRLKRGGDQKRLPLSVVDLAAHDDPREVMALDAAICRLEEQDPRTAQVVKLRFFAGLSIEDTATALSVSSRTVKRDWELARAWLYDELRPDDDDD